ncbi:MAG TPA: FCD domain-containing protein [Thermodesulfobacteriota bacterium]|nr:FCD domain-containing protein [Thermodesulfobacteriota bacterium]
MRRVFVPVRSKRTFEEVSSQIKKLILDGVLQPGDKLPSEGTLGKQFHVGRQTVREALRILELSGFISVQKGFGGGSVVRNNVLKRTSGLLLDALQMEKVGLKEFTAARLLIEKGILNEAIDRADGRDIRDLQRNVAESKALIKRGKFATDINVEFHSLLARASRNRVYVLFERTINDMHLDLRRRRSPNFAIDQAAVQAHEEILDALIEKDRDRANRLLEKHLLAVSKHYRRREINFLTRNGC